MNQELANKLYQKYPKIFRDRVKSMEETCMCWGLECGDGWYNILDVMCQSLTYSYSTGWSDPNSDKFFDISAPQVVARQVKEKYGTLRFYFHLEFTDEISKAAEIHPEIRDILARYQNYFDGVVHMAEIMSGMTCEHTGLPGELHAAGSWYATLNREYAKTLNRGYVPVADLKSIEKP